jgi:hypothetical protein
VTTTWGLRQHPYESAPRKATTMHRVARATHRSGEVGGVHAAAEHHHQKLGRCHRVSVRSVRILLAPRTCVNEVEEGRVPRAGRLSLMLLSQHFYRKWVWVGTPKKGLPATRRGPRFASTPPHRAHTTPLRQKQQAPLRTCRG